MTNVNHHSAGILPLAQIKEELYFLLEHKDPQYKSPFFDGALNFLGGNWSKGVNPDNSPKELLEREIDEEFWKRYESPESLNTLLGQDFIQEHEEVQCRYDPKTIQRIQQIPGMILPNAEHCADYLVRVFPPITRDELQYLSSIFVAYLSESETDQLQTLILKLDGKLTTDNLKRGSKIGFVSQHDIEHRKYKFAWGYDHTVEDLSRTNCLPTKFYLPQSCHHVKIEPVVVTAVKPEFKDFEAAGFDYKEKKF